MRDEIDRAIERGDAAAVSAGLSRLFRDQPTAATAAFVTTRFDRIKADLPVTPLRLAILRSFTVEPLVPLLRARCAVAGIDLTVQVGDFNVIEQELLDPDARLYAFGPDVVMISALTADVAPGVWRGDAADESLALTRIRDWAAALRRQSAASLVVQSFEEPAFAAQGILDAQQDGQRDAIHRLNAALRQSAAQHRGVYVLDYDALVARHGRLAWRDLHKHLSMRVPLRAEAFGWLADECMRFLRPLAGRTCKVIVVDLDDTLWGGVVGEVGAEGVQIGAEYPGAAYLEFQRALKQLSGRGILLAICSKNNPDEAMAALNGRPEMLLRPQDFAAVRINWLDKVENLKSIAAELNIGLDALAFADDNPVEREWVRAQAPDVSVIDLPPDPVLYADALQSPVFERLTIADEDRVRAGQYEAQRLRAGARQAAGSIEAFLGSLGMTASFGTVTDASLPRIAQLTQKTNQFNLTTRRYSEEEIARASADPATFVRSIRVTDRFGDNGLVGVAIARVSGDRCDIDSFLLSCRVIGRSVETALLADVAAEARRRGARTLEGWFRPTAKNAPAADFYPRHGFDRAREDDRGSLWELDLTARDVTVPAWIARA